MHRFLVFAALFACVCANSVNVFDVLDMALPHHGKASNGNGTVKFTPAKLPCDYTISISIYVESMFIAQTVVFVRGDFFAVSAAVSLMSSSAQAVFRPDTKFVEGNTTYLHAYAGMTADGKKDCQKNSTSWDEFKGIVNNSLALFLYPSEFDRVYDGEFQDIKCKVYVIDETNTTYYVDKNNYIIGTQAGAASISTTSRISYELKAELKDFVIDKEEYPMCDKVAYELPKKSADQCSASTARIAFIFVILSLMLSLF